MSQKTDTGEKQPKKAQHGGIRPGAGRKKGVPNRVTKILKDQILEALDEAGGVAYLVTLARETPTAFATLLGKVLPTQVTGADDGPVQVDARYSGLPPHILEMIGKK